jgi:hypothetical protein
MGSDKPLLLGTFLFMAWNIIEESEMVGRRYDKYTVIRFAGIMGTGKKINKRIFECLCDCGNVRLVDIAQLRHKDSNSCGCKTMPYKNQVVERYGVYHINLRFVYSSIIDRCGKKHHKSYKNYGGRGISVCEEWVKNWFSFYCWAMDNGWKKGLHVDRINNDGNYSPENCRIVTNAINSRNKRNTVYYEWNGRRLTVSEWSEITGIKRDTIIMRIRHLRWPIEQALTLLVGEERPRYDRFVRKKVWKVNRLTGGVIKIFKSIKSAAKEMGIDRKNLSVKLGEGEVSIGNNHFLTIQDKKWDLIR